MTGFASCFALHTLRKIVVLPAFALPMMRMRNLGHSRRIAAASKAPCLNGGTSLDDCASWLAVDMAGEDKCTVGMRTWWRSEIDRNRDQQDGIEAEFGSSDWLILRCSIGFSSTPACAPNSYVDPSSSGQTTSVLPEPLTNSFLFIFKISTLFSHPNNLST